MRKATLSARRFRERCIHRRRRINHPSTYLTSAAACRPHRQYGPRADPYPPPPLCGMPKSPYAKVPAGPHWIHEIKQDGFRLIVQREAPRVGLFTRTDHD